MRLRQAPRFTLPETGGAAPQAGPADAVFELRPSSSEGVLEVVRLENDGVVHVGALEQGRFGWRPTEEKRTARTREMLRLIARAWNRAPLLKPQARTADPPP